MGGKILVAFLFVAILFLSGCTSMMQDISGEKEAQRQAAIQQCNNVYDSCKEGCNDYWLASEKEQCRSRCTQDYQVCRSYA